MGAAACLGRLFAPSHCTALQTAPGRLRGLRVKVGPGTLYAMLARFEENGIIRKTAETGRRKAYIITETGLQMLREEYERLNMMVRDGKEIQNGL
mgnify:CR=1 FL=1